MPINFEIRRHEKEGVVILDMKGRLVVGEPSVRLRDAINQEVAQNHTHVILNLEEVDYIDSTGLGCMVICFTTIQKASGTMKLLKLTAAISSFCF